MATTLYTVIALGALCSLLGSKRKVFPLTYCSVSQAAYSVACVSHG